MTPPSEDSSRGIWLVRHAESVWNAEGRWQGHADPPLSDRGRAQAAALAEELRERGIELLLSSDLARAAETARIVGAELGLAPRLFPALRERDLGAWTGLTGEEISVRWPDELARLRAGDARVRPGDGESSTQLAARLDVFLAELAPRVARVRTALVTHRGVIHALSGARLANAQWRRVSWDACRAAVAGASRSGL